MRRKRKAKATHWSAFVELHRVRGGYELRIAKGTKKRRAAR